MMAPFFLLYCAWRWLRRRGTTDHLCAMCDKDECTMCASMLGCCGGVAALVCFWVYGGLALADAYHFTDCGEWLWVSTLVSLVLFPYLLVVVLANFVATPLLLGTSVAKGDSFEQVVVGIGLSVFLLFCVCMPATIVGVLANGLWGEHCIPHHTPCADYALGMFWTLAVLLGANAAQAAALLCCKVCKPSPVVAV